MKLLNFLGFIPVTDNKSKTTCRLYVSFTTTNPYATLLKSIDVPVGASPKKVASFLRELAKDIETEKV